MANRDLLKSAIADAKAVKETAIANAKLALEEAFTPHLKSMLSAKLEEMDNEDKVDEMYGSKKYEEDDKDVNEVENVSEEELDEMDAPSFARKNSPAGDSLKNLDPRKVGQSTVQEEEIEEEIDLDELLAELNDDQVDENKRTDAEQEGYKDGFKDAKADIKNALKDMKVSEAKDEDLEEAKKAEDKDEVKEAKSEDDDKKDVKEDARTDAEEEGYLDGMKDEKEDMEDDMEDEEIDLEDMSEEDLKGFIEDVIKSMVSAGELEPGDEFVEDEVEVEDEEDIDVDVEIDEAKKSDDDKEKVDERKSRVKGEKGVGNEDGDKDDSKIEKETEKMRFKEALDEIEALKVELQEVNLLNAKLLYTNKIFKSKNLTESKKVKVLKAFDKAVDVKQAKTIYETLNEGLLDKSSINESIKKGAASKATGLEPKSEKHPIIESNDVYNRMRQLAGLL
jgi:hypothetical protein